MHTFRTLCLVGCAVAALVGGFGISAQAAQQDKPAAPPTLGPYDDPRLQQKISLNLKDANINQAVEALAKAAKVSLIVERPDSLRLRPVTLAINDAKLRDVMDMLGQLYGYRWRRRNDVFLLTLVPVKEDMDKFGEQAMKDIYDKILTPEQRAKVDTDGFIEGKDLTPGQQGIISGYLQEMMSQLMSNNLGVGKVVIDKEHKQFSVTAGDGK